MRISHFNLLAILVAALTASSALAADQKAVSAADRTDTSGIVRAANVIGMSVKDEQNKEIGHIEDVVVDLGSGKIRYAALAFGGTLGFGEKLFAVPWQALRVQREKDSKEVSHFVSFDIEKQRLEKAPGFNKEKWPNFADFKFTSGVDKYYGQKSDPRGADRPSAVMRTSQVKGLSVRSAENKELGHVDELVFDLARGTVRYAAISYGGFLGLGDKLFAVPLSSLQIRTADDEHYFVSSIPLEKIKNANGFKQDDWPNTADARWSTDVDKYYQDKK